MSTLIRTLEGPIHFPDMPNQRPRPIAPRAMYCEKCGVRYSTSAPAKTKHKYCKSSPRGRLKVLIKE